MPLSRRLQLAAAASLAVAACAAPHGPSPATLLADGRAGERCRVAPDPAVLPEPAELVDAAALRADAARLWTAAGRPRGHVLLSIRHAADGTQVRRALIESTVPAALADSLRALVFARRLQTPAARAEWGVRLRVDLGDEVALRVGRREECPPRPRDREFRTAENPFDVRQADAASTGAQPPTDAGTVWVRVRLDEHGTVTDASVERGVRRGTWEQRVLNYVRTMSFFPALEDGYPVPAETTLPVRLSAIPSS